ncbi:MAG: bifunctional riboflavin kinase/FAD synthetase, partial [Pseudomonadota bacterium]|nr:bifunctional riboflavin kinase/FAD synthetase [Pseudomonadota bacterium]
MLTHFTLYRSLAELPDKWRGSVLAIGNFDGVHLGHHAV